MNIQTQDFGVMPDGRPAKLFTLSNASGASVRLSDVGARIVGITVPDKNGRMADVALGYPDAAACFADGRYCGAICGRYANRLRAARFTLSGKTYELARNDGNNTLHGGAEGFDVKLWGYTLLPEQNAITFRLLSPDGEEGYPGNLMVNVTYTWREDNALRIDYRAVTDKDTVVNLTNHAYFNLKGHNAGPIGGHLMQIFAGFTTPIDHEILPTGAIVPVEGTPFDFRRPTAIEARVEEDNTQLRYAGGYDHNFVLNKSARGAMELAAVVTEPESGRMLEVYTTEGGLQFYGGNFMKDFHGKDGAVYGRREGFCLETQCFPNGVEIAHFPSPVLRAGSLYTHTTEYRFGVNK